MNNEKEYHEWRLGKNGDWQLLFFTGDGKYDCLGHLCWKDEQWRWFEGMGGSCFNSSDYTEIAKKMAEMEKQTIGA